MFRAEFQIYSEEDLMNLEIKMTVANRTINASIYCQYTTVHIQYIAFKFLTNFDAIIIALFFALGFILNLIVTRIIYLFIISSLHFIFCFLFRVSKASLLLNLIFFKNIKKRFISNMCTRIKSCTSYTLVRFA